MNLSRISLLFNSAHDEKDGERLRDVLTACCRSAKYQAKYQAHYLGQIVSLTDERSAFSIDQIMENIPNYFGTPHRPTKVKRYKIVEVIDAIEQLKALGYLGDENDDFEAICLTNDLFLTIAEEWMYAKGCRPHRVASEKIFAPSLQLAMAIHQRRLNRMRKGKEVVA